VEGAAAREAPPSSGRARCAFSRLGLAKISPPRPHRDVDQTDHRRRFINGPMTAAKAAPELTP
jgi:hypothetical protein